MNEVIECLITRRSCKNYKDKQIDKKDLDLILKAGTYAANGKGQQSPIIIVLEDKEKIKQLSKINAEILGANVDPFYNAPTVLIVMADKRVFTYVEDGSLVIGNLMNAAHSLGLGSCWIHRAKEEFETPEGKALLKEWGIDENYVGIGHCLLGYANEEPKTPAKRKEDYIRFV